MAYTKQIRPVVFITFDELWRNYIQHVAKDIGNDYCPVTSAIQGIIIKSGGVYDLLTDEQLCSFDALQGDYSAESWKANHGLISNNAEAIEKILSRLVINAYAVDNISNIERLNISVSSDVSFFIISSLHHPIGSPAIPLFAKSVYRLFKYSHPTKMHRLSMLLISPDVYEIGNESSLSLARACRVLEELEVLYNNLDEDGMHDPLFDVLWLFSRINTEGRTITNDTDIASQLATYFRLWIADSFPRDESYLLKLFEKKNERARICCGLGVSLIKLPAQTIINNLKRELLEKYKEALINKCHVKSEEYVIQRTKHDFIESLDFHSVSNLLVQYDTEEGFNEQILRDISAIEQMTEYDIQNRYRQFIDTQESKLYRKIDYVKQASKKIIDAYKNNAANYILDAISMKDRGIYLGKEVFSSIQEDYASDIEYESTIYSPISYLSDLAEQKSLELFGINDERVAIDKLNINKKDMQSILDELKEEADELSERIKEVVKNKKNDAKVMVDENAISGLKSDLKNKRDRLRKLDNEYNQIEKEINSRINRIKEYKGTFKNKDKRNKLLNDNIESLRESANRIIYGLADKIRCIKQVREEIDDYNNKYKNNRLVTIASSIVSIVLTFIVMWFFINTDRILYYLIAIAIIAAIGAVTWSILYFHYARRINMCDERKKSMIEDIHNAIERASHYRNKEYRLRYNDAICKRIYEIDSWFREIVQSKIVTIDHFIENIHALKNIEEEDIDAKSSFVSYVPAETDYVNIRQNILQSIDQHLFSNEDSMLAYWKAHTINGCDALHDHIMADLDKFIVSAIPEIYNSDIEGFLELDDEWENVQSTFNTQNKLSCPYIGTHTEPGLDDSVNYEFVFTPSGKEAPVNKYLEIGNSTAIQKAYLNNEIALVKLKIGIPLPDLNIMKKREGINNLETLLKDVICDDSYSSEIENINNAGKIFERTFEIFLLAEIFGIVTKDNNAYSFNNWQYIGNKDKAINEIKKDNALLEQMNNQVEDCMKDPAAIKKLMACRDRKEYSRIEKEIINHAIDRISPIT